jgi:hypothetical protein
MTTLCLVHVQSLSCTWRLVHGVLISPPPSAASSSPLLTPSVKVSWVSRAGGAIAEIVSGMWRISRFIPLRMAHVKQSPVFPFPLAFFCLCLLAAETGTYLSNGTVVGITVVKYGTR